jgi:riboflavin kinase/FMN adenylyltransferase
LKTHNSASNFSSTKKTVVTIGTFDGVHLGHRKILQKLNTIAKQKGLESALLTFFPHPRMVLQQNQDLKLINTIAERKELLANTQIDHLIIEPFTLEFSRLTAEEYIKNYLVDYLKAKVIIVGYDHRFGRNRKANIENLRDFAKAYDFGVVEISKQDIDDVAVSSTKIRKAIANGDIHLANLYLSTPFTLSGNIVKGKQIGKTIGFPTANLKVEEDYKIIPKNGVYVVKTMIEGKSYFGMMNIGHNPTVSLSDEKFIETYFFDFNGDLYGIFMKIEVLKRIRDEKKFDGLDQLVEAMKSDELYSRNYINQL